MPDRLVDKPCPPGQHRHGGHNYCHPEGRKHHSHAGEATHGLKYPKERTTRPRAKPQVMTRVGELRRLMDAGWAEPKDLGNKLMQVNERLRGKVSQDVLALLRHASGRLQAGDMEDGMLYVDQAFRRYRDEITGGHEYEGKMTKAEEKRQDAEPTVPYEEDYAQIFEVENRLKATARKLERMIDAPRSAGDILSNLQKLEKQLTDGCCS